MKLPIIILLTLFLVDFANAEVKTTDLINKYGFNIRRPDFAKTWTSGCHKIDASLQKKMHDCVKNDFLRPYTNIHDYYVCKAEKQFLFFISDTLEQCQSELEAHEQHSP